MSPDGLVVFGDLLASTSIRAAALAAAVGAALALCRVPPGAVRHAAWAVVTTAMLVMPGVLPIVPAVEIPWPVLAVPARSPAAPALMEAAPETVAGEATAAESARQQPPAAVVASRVASPAPIANASAAAAPQGLPWASMALAVYGAGVVLFLTRLAIGWALVRRLLRTSQPCRERVADAPRIELRESARIATPLTVGLLRPAVLLPVAWQSWPAEHLRAVLAHELAHARRYDPLVACVAYVNRAIFWFHPLSWWLARTLAVHAEDACDTAAMTTVEAPRRYAEVLTAMAEAVRRHGGRVAWQGVGVDGAGMLEGRVDRILRGDRCRDVPRARRIAIAASCVVAIAAAVSCRPAAPPPAPLEPDPAVTERRARQDASSEEFKATVAMSGSQVANLEAALQQKPDDLETRKDLLVFYRLGTEKSVGWNERVIARRRHILWLIEHCPADRWLPQAGGINPAFDPDGYAKAKGLWLAVTSTNDVSSAALGNAASFFWEFDGPLAEQFLLRAKAIDPDGPTPRVEDNTYYASWSARLGSLYVTAMLGFPPHGPRPPGKTPTSAPPDAAFAAEARQKLAKTSDAAMLTSAGQDLVRGVSLRWPDAAQALGFDPEALGVSYLERAARLDPERTAARQVLAGLTTVQRWRRTDALLKGVPRDQQPAWVRTLPDADRMAVLPELAESSSTEAGFPEGPTDNAAARAAARAQARAYAEDTLALAAKLSSDPDRGTAIFRAHVTLALQAMRENDMSTAVSHMDAAAQAPPSDELRYGNTFRWQLVATGMLKRGERESVARFLDRCAALTEVKSTREQMSTAAAAIRAGRMPEFYQYQTMPQ